jgi:hypothetical protein
LFDPQADFLRDWLNPLVKALPSGIILHLGIMRWKIAKLIVCRPRHREW